jgi:hypothetical protein
VSALGIAACTAVAITALAPAAVATHPNHHPHPHFTTVISGLNAPRGITFDGRGNLYVSESGVAGKGDAGLTHTGRVTKYSYYGYKSWSRNFESLFIKEDPSQPPDVLGPEGLSTLSRDCFRHDERGGRHRHHHDACPISMIMSESHDGIAAATKGAIQTKQMGFLYELSTRSGRTLARADVGDQNYAFTTVHKNLFPSDFPDANPFGVLVTRDLGDSHGYHRNGTRTFVADAGANTIGEVNRFGQVRTISYIPNETKKPFRDATPTCIAQGPDGMLYVGTLHLVAGVGRADVWRVDPDANFPTPPTLWASGLTTLTSCTFDRYGNFWATELLQPNKHGAPGDIVRLPFNNPTHVTHVGGGHLPLPIGITVGPDGALYVNTNSASPVPGSGTVVRVSF